MDEFNEFELNEEVLAKLRNPEQLRMDVSEGKSFQEIFGYSDLTMEKFYSAARALFERQLYDEAAEAFYFLTTMNPYVHNFWLGLGMAEQMSNKFQEAILAYSMAVMTDSLSPLPHYHMGTCYHVLGDKEQSQNSYRLAKSFAENKPDFENILAQAQSKLN